MGAHVIGRPGDDLLEILLGEGAEPEQAFMGSQGPRSEPGALEEPEAPGEGAPAPDH